jgi:RNA:NAD 2'-phosphotransferase (TPT1/KptA family)
MRPEDIGALIAVEQGVKPAMVRKAMFNESEKVKRRPPALFHATPLHNFESIKENGILPHSFYGQIYLCDNPEHCLNFVKTPCVIFQIDPKLLDIKKMVFSKDHNKTVLKFDVYAYYKKIFPSAIKNWGFIN